MRALCPPPPPPRSLSKRHHHHRLQRPNYVEGASCFALYKSGWAILPLPPSLRSAWSIYSLFFAVRKKILTTRHYVLLEMPPEVKQLHSLCSAFVGRVCRNRTLRCRRPFVHRSGRWRALENGQKECFKSKTQKTKSQVNLIGQSFQINRQRSTIILPLRVLKICL